MKKILLTTTAAVALLAATLSSQAQGTLGFANANAHISTSNTVNGSTAQITAGNFVFGFYGAATTNALLSSTTPIFTVTNSGFAGTVSGANITLPSGFPQGTVLVFEVKGWTINVNNQSLESALAIAAGSPTFFYGTSAIGMIALGGSTGTPPPVWQASTGPAGGTIGPFLLTNPAPEPSTFALGGLGVAALWALRRRKS